MADYEVFDYPGEYLKTGDGEQYVKTRLEEIQTQFEVLHAQGNARGVTVGSLFKLTGHPRRDQNHDYLIIRRKSQPGVWRLSRRWNGRGSEL